jgi:prepilin-type N-terminal cleavage/methylation domain-containing protein
VVGRRTRRRGRSDRGMTLVEIMITLIISSIIAASTFMFFAGQQRIYETQTKVLNIQQNLWAAMEVVARYTRASGSGMFECVIPASYPNADSTTGARKLSTSPSPGPLTTDLSLAPQTGVRAYSSTAANGMQFIPPLWIVNNTSADAAAPNVVPNTDIMTVAFGSRTSGMDTDEPITLNLVGTGPTDILQLKDTNAGNMFRSGEFVLVLNTPNWGYGNDPTTARGCTMFQVIGNPAGATILPHPSASFNAGDLIWNPPASYPAMLVGGGYTGGSAGVRNFGTLTWVRFFIQQNGANGIPNLMMQQLHLSGNSGLPQVLAEGIEDFQISFACDTGSPSNPRNLTQLNGQLDEGSNDTLRQTDEWWNNVPNDNLPAQFTDGYCNLPTAVRLTLVARTLSPDDLIDTSVTSNGPLDVEDHRYSTPRPSDQFRRRVLTTTVYPRNNKPL